MSSQADIIRRYLEVEQEVVHPAEWRTEALTALAALVAENQLLRDALEDYLLWEPGRAGHAEAHRRLAAALGRRDA